MRTINCYAYYYNFNNNEFKMVELENIEGSSHYIETKTKKDFYAFADKEKFVTNKDTVRLI